MLTVRAARAGDADAIWTILEPTIRAGDTYTLPREMSREAALAFWFASGHEVFVAEEDGGLVGTYFLRANQAGGGSHVANCGYVTAAHAAGIRVFVYAADRVAEHPGVSLDIGGELAADRVGFGVGHAVHGHRAVRVLQQDRPGQRGDPGTQVHSRLFQ